MTIFDDDAPTVKAGTSSVHTDLPEVEVFRRLAESRRRRDCSQLRELTTQLRRLGWTVMASEPRPSIRRADR